MTDALILHEDARSGNCYKIRLTAAHLDIPLEFLAYDIMNGETRTPSFLAGLYPYTHVAEEGGIDLVRCPAVNRWFARGSGLPGHVLMEV